MIKFETLLRLSGCEPSRNGPLNRALWLYTRIACQREEDIWIGRPLFNHESKGSFKYRSSSQPNYLQVIVFPDHDTKSANKPFKSQNLKSLNQVQI